MDQFTVPQFIEHKAKIVGPLTFQQFIFVGLAAAICFFFYFTLPFYFFILATIVIMLGGVALAFVKIGGRSLPVILKNFFFFSLSPKIYLWKKKTGGLPPKLIEKAPEAKEEVPVPTIAGKSRLNTLSTQVEIKTK
ncbi:MAG: hypothetical protein COT59_00885 [Candidatus Nealsonbacteria bacterium CG09_land_8_20_14_0_10_42_14]|uniref:PrgI family protein n=1 Tax=Candidatus Nealsonbacteria bacterium CG09_land_8_20_14_0_10_42_14 TaxID=1974707 RepID=A0A2H0WXJ4_9BACT|nr:MAG: hypothetical protein COT59_00885 [Candidatus Nealsonbacteria bacterium CG09_land_8_20_14_0_10_42_14]